MNIKGILDLSEQLSKLGFSDLANPLVKHICFGPQRFVINYQTETGGNCLRCQLSFERNSETASGYAFVYYDAMFQTAQLYDGTINGVDVSQLADEMSEIDWAEAFDFTEKKKGTETGKEAFGNELKVAAVIDRLSKLQSSPNGKIVAISLKQKYWFGVSGIDGSGSSENAYKGKTDVSQRFYVIDDQPSISVNEAYRYLQNRWLEKEMLAKRKQQDNISDEDTEATGFGTGLLKKKRRRKPATSNGKK